MSIGVSEASSALQNEVFGISAVSRLTGISPHVLRIWERRYQVVEPKRSDTQRREYDREDVHRLTLVKSLVDHGHSIRHVASQPTEQLESLLGETGEAPTETIPQDPKSDGPLTTARIAYVGSMFRDALREAADSVTGLKIVAEDETMESLGGAIKPGSVDLLVIESPTLFEEQVLEVQKLVSALQARRAVLIYRFAKHSVVEPLDKDLRMVTAMRAPVDAAELRLACTADLKRPDPAEERQKENEAREAIARNNDAASDDVPARHFSDPELAKIARITSVVQCECPQHLASLLSSLSAFEAYSAACENQGETDAQLHAYLHRTTAECRAEMEAALLHVLDVENISLADLD